MAATGTTSANVRPVHGGAIATGDIASGDWTPAILQRRRALMQRLVMGAATAMIFSRLFGWQTTVIWVSCYFAIQILDLAVFAPVKSASSAEMPRWRRILGGVMMALNSAGFSSLSILLWVYGGPMGGVCAAIVLASGAIYAVVNSPRSALVLALILTPHVLYFCAMPLFMLANGAQPAFVSAVTIAIVVFIAYCFTTWRSIDKAYVSESQARVEAEARRVEMEAAMAGRAAFLAAVAHDLRTPIGAILTGAAEMDRGVIEGSSRANAALITDAGMMMKALLDDLLDHSKLEAGRMSVEVDDFNLRLMLAQTMRLWAGPVRAKGLSLRIEGAKEMPAIVRGDAMRLRQVLNNLISNAVKFTETGAITLRLSAWAEEPSGHAVLIEVADSGPGMTAAQAKRLFTPFDQTAEGVSSKYGGTGLGLAISRDLVELMGGRLTARSAPGLGARFTVSLVLDAAVDPSKVVSVLDADSRRDVARSLATLSPLRAVPVEPVVALPAIVATEALVASAAPVAEAGSSGVDEAPGAADEDAYEDRPLRVLVVDDHDINRRAVELILTPLGCDIATAADGLIALGLCETHAFDVIFMDVRMPELDGRETTRRLRAGGGVNAMVPVIAVTADTAPEDIAACMAAGMTYFVSKPLTPPALLGALQHVLSGDAEDEGVADQDGADTIAA